MEDAPRQIRGAVGVMRHSNGAIGTMMDERDGGVDVTPDPTGAARGSACTTGAVSFTAPVVTSPGRARGSGIRAEA